jgi:hypothetical protein
MDSPILSNILKIISLIIGVIGIIISLQIKSRVDNKDALFKTLIRRTKQSILNWKSLSQLAEN